jgi:hypothetical protein
MSEKQDQKSLQEKFFTYDQENPDIWKAFEKFSLEAASKGRKYIGAKMIYERIRWYTQIEAKTGFKINNNYTSYYARKFQEEYPQLEGLFRTRKLKNLKNH